ncbi:hypothetical protein Fmac_023242 [Flemingia macrophylla]|uniref:Uncharacterized protein n=1 Tax=Flemingia macrophylla TaxID=520843 RepID=A0ABD1LKY0_9FABA
MRVRLKSCDKSSVWCLGTLGDNFNFVAVISKRALDPLVFQLSTLQAPPHMNKIK